MKVRHVLSTISALVLLMPGILHSTSMKKGIPELDEWLNTPCTTLDQLDPEVKSNTEDAFTLYRDEILFKRYDQAVGLWRQAYYTAPGANGKATYHFDDGIKIYDHLFKSTSSEELKQSYVDTIISIYDKRIECFGDDGTLSARKAFNGYYYYRRYVSEDQIFAWFKEVIDKKGLDADYFAINPFSKMIYDRVLEEKIALEEARKYTYAIFDIIKNGLANCEDPYCEAWEVINEYAPNLLEGLEGIRGYYDCEYYMNKYYPQFLEDTSNCDNVTEVYLRMIWANCDSLNEQLVYMKGLKDVVCYVPPPPPGPLKLANDALNRGDFGEAIAYYDQYVAETDDPENKADKLLRISKIYYAHIKNFPAARRYALEAAQYKSNWGEPYMLIGKLYASSGPLCGPGRGWDSQIVTWPAIDKFEYAKSIDPSVADEANRWIQRYSQYMPSAEDLHQRTSINEGDRFKVNCWIQEWTTVRKAPRQG